MFDTFAVDSFDTYIGQEKLKERLRLHIESANSRQATMDHVLLDGPPGVGKSTLAMIIADELCVGYDEIIMPVKPQVLKQIAMTHSYEPGVVLFDEIHRCSDRQQEELLPLIQKLQLYTNMGQVIDAPYLTVVAATTEPDKIIEPLYDRFKIKPKFEEYTDAQMGKIAEGMAKKVGLDLTRRQLKQIGRASGGTPRNAGSLIVMARDLMEVTGKVTVKEVLERCNVTESGLTEDHLDYLRILADYSPSGLEVIMAQMRLPKSVILNLETLLIKRKLIQRTKSGREILTAGYKVIK